MTLILTRPQHDVTTRYLAAWAEEIIALAREKSIKVIDLFRDKANQKELAGRIRKLDPKLVFLNGHGRDDAITGNDNQVLIKADENHELLQGRITYALSCNSGQVLGVKVAENAASVFIGYNSEFIFLLDRSYTSRPADDPTAKPFKEPSNQVMISLLKGHSAQEASERSKRLFQTHCIALSTSNAGADALQAAQLLWWNMRNQACLGNGEMKLPGSESA